LATPPARRRLRARCARDDEGSWQHLHDPGNVTVIVGDDGVVLIDAKFARCGSTSTP
jgi:hypothetical protein